MMGHQQLVRARQARFLASSPTISNGARRPADRIGQRHRHLLARGHEEENLYPSLRGSGGAIEFFRARRIKWWQGRTSGDALESNGPTRNLASSQIACVNFLLPLAQIPGSLEAALRTVDEEVESVVSLSYQGFDSTVEFEWTGLDGPLEPTANATRGCGVTSGDALLVANTRSRRRGYLMEWKLAESYENAESKGEGAKGEERRKRYTALYSAPDSSFNGAAYLDDWFYEPLYQLMRLRLLADQMVRAHEFGMEEVIVVVVCPSENTTYLNHVTSQALKTKLPRATSLADVMAATLRRPDSFTVVSPTSLLAGVRQAGLGLAADSWCAYQSDRHGW
jgi:hypothetical protein